MSVGERRNHWNMMTEEGKRTKKNGRGKTLFQCIWPHSYCHALKLNH